MNNDKEDRVLQEKNEIITKLYEDYYDIMYSIYYSWASNMNLTTDIVEDTITDAFMKLRKQPLAKLQKIAKSPFGYIRTTVKNRFIDTIRKHEYTEEITDTIVNRFAESIGIESELSCQDIITALKEQLPNHYAEIIFLTIDGYTKQEIANLLEKEVNTIYVTLHRARKKARAILATY